MGTSLGPVLLGIYFTTLGLWWITQIPRRFLICKQRSATFYSSLLYPCCSRICIAWPLDALVRLLALCGGLIVQLLAATDYFSGAGVVFVDDLQVAMVFIFFGIATMVEVMVWRGTVDISGIDYMANIVAYVMETLFFYNYSVDVNEYGIKILELLCIIMIACTVTSFWEMQNRASLLPAILRLYLCVLKGTWMMQFSYVHYNSKSLEDNMSSSKPNTRDMALVSVYLSWHVILDLVIVTLLAVMSRVCVKKCCVPEMGHELEMDIWPSDLRINRGSRNNLLEDCESECTYRNYSNLDSEEADIDQTIDC